MNELEVSKIVGAVCGALLVFMLLMWAGEIIYETGHGHGKGDHAAGYVIEVEEEAETEVAEEGPSLDEMMASAEVAKGEKVFKKCASCHALEAGVAKTGPSLAGVVGRDIASADGFGYSEALAGLDGDWTREALDGFLTKPSSYAKGNKMSFGGLKKPMDRANVIMYLESVAN